MEQADINEVRTARRRLRAYATSAGSRDSSFRAASFWAALIRIGRRMSDALQELAYQQQLEQQEYEHEKHQHGLCEGASGNREGVER
jgi:hypothetical protein